MSYFNMHIYATYSSYERIKGFEPLPSDWKSAMLPLTPYPHMFIYKVQQESNLHEVFGSSNMF